MNRFVLMLAVTLLTSMSSAAEHRVGRVTFSLDGLWQIAEGGMDTPPSQFDRVVPVPGLVDLARPAFVEPGPKVPDRVKDFNKDPRRDAFWYRRTFSVNETIPTIARLKVGKAMYGTRVILNGRTLGDHVPSFTPGWFDAKPALKKGKNEVLIRIGADREVVTKAVPTGFDFEKDRYIPGIFDSVELILSGEPHIKNLQVAPDLAQQSARVRVWLSGAGGGQVSAVARECKTNTSAGSAAIDASDAAELVIDLVVPLADCHLWSPEDPFLYEIAVQTSGDVFTTRFGMRELRFDPATGRAMLNGKPYFMRGSNFTVYRFFEDAARGTLPWDEAWVRNLHRAMKAMHWNSLRYCIGFPPEAWYRIADEEGLLIQDEFPLWHGDTTWSTSNWPKELTREQLAIEYAEWMRERWNHPSVVIWDASNETTSTETTPAIRHVRALDLSSRPWDNSYMPPDEPGDVVETHPYHFQDPNHSLSDLATANPAPWAHKPHAAIINEYGWLWLNRDGTPTTLTKGLYENHLGKNSTTAERRRFYARTLAADTEFFRAHRQAAAVMHFCSLSYSRADGQTSDHWLDVASLRWEPEFYRYVRDAFAPIGAMIDAWAPSYPAGTTQRFDVIVFNDTLSPWHGDVRFRVLRGDEILLERTRDVAVSGGGTTPVAFTLQIPEQVGSYTVKATLLATPEGDVSSLRDFEVLPHEQALARRNLAEGRAVTCSSARSEDGRVCGAALAVDGKNDTAWRAGADEPQWIAVDLGETQNLSRIELNWDWNLFAQSYEVQRSTDGVTWRKLFSVDAADQTLASIRFEPTPARWIRVLCLKPITSSGYGLYELRAFSE